MLDYGRIYGVSLTVDMPERDMPRLHAEFIIPTSPNEDGYFDAIDRAIRYLMSAKGIEVREGGGA